MTLPNELTDLVTEGEAVLFVGSGASRDVGAPTGPELAALLATEFGKGQMATTDVQQLADVLESYRSISRTDIDRSILRILRKFSPGKGHERLSNLRWRAIFTTNYDELIENAYRASATAGRRPPQEINVVVGPDDLYSADDPTSVAIFKMHGCLSRLERLPLVLSTADFRNTTKRREKWLRYLRQLSRRHAILFIGYSFVDGVGIRLLNDIREASPYGNSRQMFAIDPAFENSDARSLLADLNVVPVALRFGEFFERLDAEVSGQANRQVLARGIDRFDAASGPVDLDARLRLALESQLEQLSPRGPQRDARTFLSGRRPIAADFRGHNDVDRDRLAELVSVIEVALKSEEYLRPMIAVLGNGGAGKNTLASRAAFEVANSNAAVSFALKDHHDQWNAAQLLELVHGLQAPVVFVVNDLEQPKRMSALQKLRAEISSARVPVTFLVSCQKATWNKLARDASGMTTEFNIEGRLSKQEAAALVTKLREHKLLKDPGLDAHSLERKVEVDCDGHLVVAMLELAAGGRFSDILLLEYQNLSANAAAVYRNVALVHQYGIAVPDYVLNAVTVNSWEVFINDVVKLDSELVFAQEFNLATKRMYFSTRHPLIAKTIVDVVVPKNEDRVRLLLGMIGALAGTNEDRFLAIQILTHDKLREDLGEASHVDRLFERAQEVFPNDRTVILHLGKWEVRKGNLERARELLEFGRSLDPRDSYLVNELGVCALRQAEASEQGVVREARYNEAFARFREKQRLDPASHYGFAWEARCHLSKAYRMPGQARFDSLSGALDSVRRGLSTVRPDERPPLDELKPKLLHELRGDQDAIRDLMLKAEVEVLPYGSWYHLLAICYLEGKDRARALATASRGLEIYGSDERLKALVLDLLEGELHVPGVRDRVRALIRKPSGDRVMVDYLEAVCRYYDDDFRGAKEAFEIIRERHQGLASRVRTMFSGADGAIVVKKGEWNWSGSRRLVRELDSGLRLQPDHVLWRMDPGAREVRYSVGFGLLGIRAVKPSLGSLSPPAQT